MLIGSWRKSLYTVHQDSTWWLWDGSIVGKGHKHLQSLAPRLRQDVGAFHEPKETSQNFIRKPDSHYPQRHRLTLSSH